jgi:hypothetical protein
MYNIPRRYIPFSLSRKDKMKQKNMILRSRKLYKNKQFFTRKRLHSFKSKPSKHVINAKRIYNIDNILPSRELAKKTGCSIDSLKKIVNKGEGAYYSSGSRPNQTAQSWGIARLASAITGGKASQVDFSILKEGCNHTRKAYRLAKKNL